MDDVLQLSDKLSSDPDTVGHFTINEDVELLHRDFQGVTNELERLQKFLSRGNRKSGENFVLGIRWSILRNGRYY